MQKKRIAVIFGGNSTEYEVSLQSAHAVLEHISPDRYDIIAIGITRDGDMQTLLPADLVFPVLHGKNGEDGTLQGMFELAGMPLVGCGMLASALCMDKERAHRLVSLAGIAVPKSAVFHRHSMDAVLSETKLAYPQFVKPVRAGSSFGITNVSAPEERNAAIEIAFLYDEEAVFEEAVEGFEVGCAVLEKDEPAVGRVDETELPCLDGFYDLILQVTDYPRNGIFLAPLFFALGAYTADHPAKLTPLQRVCGCVASFALMLIEALMLHSLQLMRHDSMYLFLPVCMFSCFTRF